MSEPLDSFSSITKNDPGPQNPARFFSTTHAQKNYYLLGLIFFMLSVNWSLLCKKILVDSPNYDFIVFGLINKLQGKNSQTNLPK